MIFFFNDTATTEIYTLSLHDALPIYGEPGTPGGAHSDEDVDDDRDGQQGHVGDRDVEQLHRPGLRADRKSTRLNSSHANISYAVFCLKKKNNVSVGKHARRSEWYMSE